ncbi:hypothetical protein [Cyanobium sp. Copco_Reservoir_LC18]|uniref:hypothetical protein n=1 Tax=Cyanobium sp. Copco_Reservoir_LC18 TaxID=1328305 RepID=UPI001356C037|nr:hypothetical protein [Cyanobium sp. Copco_Reservoir_LC18]
MKLGRIETQRKSGAEPLHANGSPLGVSLQEFWQWSGSDLVSNSQRGILAEFLVAQALGVVTGVRTEWDAYDVVTAAGIKVEVKASGFVQSWAQEKLSSVGFDIAPKLGWDASTNMSATEACRPADVYVFAVHFHTDQASIDPLNVNQWEFYVLATSVLDQQCMRQKRISLATLQKLCPRTVPFDGLCVAVTEAACCNPSHPGGTASPGNT